MDAGVFRLVLFVLGKSEFKNMKLPPHIQWKTAVMIATTHGFIGALPALTLYFVAPEYFFVALVAALLGVVFPDLDLYRAQRELLHFPVHYNIVFVLFLPVLIVFPSAFTLSVSFFLLSAGVNRYIDRFGGPKDSRPRKYDSGKAVYSHYNEGWWSPLKIIPYNGSWQDLCWLLAAGLSVLCLLGGDLRLSAILLVIVSCFYTAFRRIGMEILPESLFGSVEAE